MNITFFGSSTIGEKGQVVIPVEGRQKLDLKPGDKLIFMGDLDKGVLLVAKAEVFEEHMSNLQASFQTVREQIKNKS
ncbi:MAG: AbrB/MazE/SpoVT family DNA-binding domain-containing protein [Thermoleophilia bacterium]|nr:AbrB/MazE/SpoVT family DNA-binding domain-containing protein [Thermoleophilia bacterium]